MERMPCHRTPGPFCPPGFVWSRSFQACKQTVRDLVGPLRSFAAGRAPLSASYSFSLVDERLLGRNKHRAPRRTHLGRCRHPPQNPPQAEARQLSTVACRFFFDHFEREGAANHPERRRILKTTFPKRTRRGSISSLAR